MPLPKQRRIVALSAVLVAALIGLAWALDGFTEDGVRIVVRHTAKLAMFWFAAAFGASSLHALAPSTATQWLIRHRRGLGLSFALTHIVHLGSLVVLGVWFPDPFVAELDAVTLVGGGIAYAFVVLMAATSWDGAVRWLGAKRWRGLHTVGSYYIWLIFFQSYLGRAVHDLSYAPFVAVLVGALGARAARRLAVRRRAGAAAPA